MIDLPLRISGALAGLAMVLAFLHSALQVAVINREKGHSLSLSVLSMPTF